MECSFRLCVRVSLFILSVIAYIYYKSREEELIEEVKRRLFTEIKYEVPSKDIFVEPCNNFYEFACADWIKKNRRRDRWDRFKEAEAITNMRLRAILEKEDTADDFSGIKNARKFYRSCLDVDLHAKLNMGVLLDRLALWGGWPIAVEKRKQRTFDWKKLMIDLMRTNNASPLLEISVDADRRNTSRNVILIDQGRIDCLSVRHKDKVLDLVKFIISAARIVAKAANQNVSKKSIFLDVIEVTLFQSRLCKYVSTEADREDEFKLYNPMTVAELQKMTDEVKLLKADSRIDWVNLLNNFLKGADINVNGDQVVIVQDPDFVVKVIRTVDETTRRTLANYLLLGKIYSMYENISPEFREIGYESGDVPRPRWDTCVADSNKYFALALGYEYVKLYLDEDAKKDAEEIVLNIVNSFVEEFKESDWMDEKTRAYAIEKANSIVLTVGYPDWLMNKTIMDNIFSAYKIGSTYILNIENILLHASNSSARSLLKERDRRLRMPQIAVVNAFYSDTFNAISIPAGILQAPFYVKGRPEAMNYGAIGAIIGHEISHAFDVSGRLADKFGNLLQWWSNDTLDTYLVKKECIEKLYGKYPVPELPKDTTPHIPHGLDGVGTFSENIGDISGVRGAFAAYQRVVQQNETREKNDSRQLFYIGYASVWCESGNLKSLVEDILHDVHSPNKYRVLIPLGNSEDFADAWNCTEDEFKMKPSETCEFW